MIDIQLIRQHPDLVAGALRKRHDNTSLEGIILKDLELRQIIVSVEKKKARRNEINKEMGKLRQKGPDSKELTEAVEESKSLSQEIDTLQIEMARLGNEINSLLLTLPNIPDSSVPEGEGEKDNKIVGSWREPRKFPFDARPHWELAEKLDVIDFNRATKLSGARFYLLKGDGASLQRGLISMMLDYHVREHGYREIYPPYLVKPECLYGNGSLPKFGDNLYHDEEDNLWLIPTAEVPLTNLHREEILDGSLLPINYCAFTACFRREKMSAGKDTRGIKRVHQFDKVELYKLTTPETSEEELTKLLKDAEHICRALELPYRIVQLCTADLGFAAARTFDIEVWAPGCQEWLEVSSCSNCGDFQARRANIRYRPQPQAKPMFVHTLNGSGLALPRVVIAVIENYQQADGSIRIPEALRPYMRKEVIS